MRPLRVLICALAFALPLALAAALDSSGAFPAKAAPEAADRTLGMALMGVH